MNKKLRILAVAMTVTVIAAACFLINRGVFSKHLTVKNRDTHELYASYDLKEGDCFSITFIHSVNKTPVTDYFFIENGHIVNEACKYYGFGAGVQTQLNEGEQLEYTDDGGMLITNIHANRDNVGYIVGTVSDHILRLNADPHEAPSGNEDAVDISLRDMCGRSTAIRFNYE